MSALPSDPPVQLDIAWLQSVGLGDLPPATANELLTFLYERLEVSVGRSLAAGMTTDELDEFEALIDRNDRAGALEWLEGHVPDYLETTREHFKSLTQAVRADAASFVEVLSREAAPQSEETR